MGKVPELKAAISHNGFALLDIWGICPGRYTRRNKLTPKTIAADLTQLPELPDFKSLNARMEYGQNYRREVAQLGPPPQPISVEAFHPPLSEGRQEVVILGSAGQRIITAGELLCIAGASAGCHATQKNDYPITVMRGHSVSEVILDGTEIDYTGIEDPSVVIALAQERVNRRQQMLQALTPKTTLIKASNVALPPCRATTIEVDFKAKKIKSPDWALAALAFLAGQNRLISQKMLTSALQLKFNPTLQDSAQIILDKMAA